jgi:hypothetical protein
MMKLRLLRFPLVMMISLPLFLNTGSVLASSCFINSDCVYDLQTEDGTNALVYGETVKFVNCFNGRGVTRLEVKENGRWRLAARSRVKTSTAQCGRKFPFRHVYSWQVDSLPAASAQKLQMRLVSGSWKKNWLQPIYESEQEVLDGLLQMSNCFSKVIQGLDC